MNKKNISRSVSPYPSKKRHRSINVFATLWFCVVFIIIIAGIFYLTALFREDEKDNNHSHSPDSTNSLILPQGSAENIDTDETRWSLILVNKWNPIPDDYQVNLTQLDNGESVDSRIYPSLEKMFDAAREDGIYPVVVSGYRTAETQQDIMDEKIKEFKDKGFKNDEARELAEAWVAPPGMSEHQIGLAVDINADGINSAGYEVYEWLNENSYLYGFICRYPTDKTELTGVNYEPWHFRYVGIEAAGEIKEKEICLEEYLDMLSTTDHIEQ